MPSSSSSSAAETASIAARARSAAALRSSFLSTPKSNGAGSADTLFPCGFEPALPAPISAGCPGPTAGSVAKIPGLCGRPSASSSDSAPRTEFPRSLRESCRDDAERRLPLRPEATDECPTESVSAFLRDFAPLSRRSASMCASAASRSIALRAASWTFSRSKSLGFTRSTRVLNQRSARWLCFMKNT